MAGRETAPAHRGLRPAPAGATRREGLPRGERDPDPASPPVPRLRATLAVGTSHHALLSLPTGIWRRTQHGLPSAAGDTVVLHLDLPEAVVVGGAERGADGPPSVRMYLAGLDIDADVVVPPDTVTRWEHLLARHGWTPLVSYRSAAPRH